MHLGSTLLITKREKCREEMLREGEEIKEREEGKIGEKKRDK
jgi:hypothetical protein